MKLLLIRNPGSRAGRGRKTWRLWARRLQSRGVDFDTVDTRCRGHARSLAQTAEAYTTVVAVGGDGTINEVLDGVMLSGRENVSMGVLYSGTSPDFCTFHGIPVDAEKAVSALLESPGRKVDVVEIKRRDAAGREVTGHFACSCNIGMGAAIARIANRSRSLLGDTAGTGLGVLHTLACNRRVDMELVADGKKVSLSLANHVFIAKNPYIASGLKLKLDISPDDGWMYVVALAGFSRMRLLQSLRRFYDGSIVDAPGVLVKKCRSLTIKAAGRQEIEYDGDPNGFLPADMKLLPGALILLGTRNG